MLQTLTQHTTNESFNEFIQQLSEVSGLNPWSRLGVEEINRWSENPTVTFASHGKNVTFALHSIPFTMNPELIIPLFGIAAGIIIPISVFTWMYFDEKGKRKAVMEIARHLDDPSKVEELLHIFDERKKEPIDYRRGGVITLFVGLGLFTLGFFFLGSILKGVGALVGFIGLGVLIAGYLYPNTGHELTNAVDHFERK
jgi:hypothetical protein